VLEEIARQVRDSARITIIGYTDRIGDERYNIGLSTQRAEQASSALQMHLRRLGTRDVKIKSSGAGMETERFTNDLPEGRALSRGVTVVIEQEPLSEHTGP
jgi:OOP family OmpA-OmpF porin